MEGKNSSDVHNWITSSISILREQLIGNPISAPKVYDLGYKILAISFLISLIGSFTAPSYFIYLTHAFLWGCAIAWSVAFCIETATLIPKVAGNKFFLSALALASIPVVKFSSIWIGRFINSTTGADPGELPDAVSALHIIFVPITWLYIAMAMLMVTLFIMITAGPLWSMMAHSGVRGRAFVARLLVTILAVSYGFLFADFLKGKSLEASVFILVASEYFEDSRCKNLSAEDVAAHLESGLSVYNTKTKVFRFDTCQ